MTLRSKNNRILPLLGSGEGSDYSDGRLKGLKVSNGEEAQLYRVVSEAEYISIIDNGDVFVEYDFAMGMKWFALTPKDALAWAKWLYKDAPYEIIEVTILKEALKYMFFSKWLDDIGPAYAADIELLNGIVRKVKLYEKSS